MTFVFLPTSEWLLRTLLIIYHCHNTRRNLDTKGGLCATDEAKDQQLTHLLATALNSSPANTRKRTLSVVVKQKLSATSPNMVDEKLMAWLDRAGGDIEEMDNEDAIQWIEDEEDPQSQDVPAHEIYHSEDEAGSTGIVQKVAVTIPRKAHKHAKGTLQPLATRRAHQKRCLGGLKLTPKTTKYSMPELGSHPHNKHREQFLVSPSPVDSYERSTQSSIRHLLDAQSSRRLKFHLIIHPPEGEKLEKWKRLQRSVRGRALDDQFLKPPPTQQTQYERNKERRKKKEVTRGMVW